MVCQYGQYSPIRCSQFQIVFYGSRSSSVMELIPFCVQVFRVGSSGVQFPTHFLVARRVVLVFLRAHNYVVPRHRTFLVLYLVRIRRIFRVLIRFPSVYSNTFGVLLYGPSGLLRFLFFNLPHRSQGRIFLFRVCCPPMVCEVFREREFHGQHIERGIPTSFFYTPVEVIVSYSNEFTGCTPDRPSRPCSPFARVPYYGSNTARLHVGFT